MGGIPILVDLDQKHIDYVADEIKEKYEIDAVGTVTDVTSPVEVEALKQRIIVDYQHVRPPSTAKTAPVMYDEASDIKNATAALYSSGFAIRPSGIRLERRSTKIES